MLKEKIAQPDFTDKKKAVKNDLYLFTKSQN